MDAYLKVAWMFVIVAALVAVLVVAGSLPVVNY